MATIYQTRYARMQEIIRKHGGTKAAVAEKLEITRQYMQALASDKPTKNIGNKIARHVERTFGYPIGYMDQPLDTVIDGDDGTITIPVLDVRGSLGPSAILSETTSIISLLRLQKAFLMDRTRGVSTSSLRLHQVADDSMAPTFMEGSAVIVDKSVCEINADGVYVIDRGGEIYIKRIQRKPSGGVLMISDNTKFLPQVIEAHEMASFNVLGRALFELTLRKV